MLYWFWLSRALEPPSKSLKPLLEHFSDPHQIYLADEAALKAVEGLSEKDRRALLDKSMTKAEIALHYCHERGVSVLTYADENYPNALREIVDPPVLLYYRGTVPEWNIRPCFGVVGTREMSQYGAEHAYEIAYDLGIMGCITVSGMALGIDGVVGAATLAAGGDTVAVLGCGIDFIYPPEHMVLYDAIIRDGGIVITEYAPGEGPNGFHFPIRNRIISGLSRAVIVVEGHGESGALITADLAKKQGRDVCAVPGSIDEPLAEGPLCLIKEGAFAVTGADDVYNRYHMEYFAYMNGFKLLELRSITLKELIRRYQISIGFPRPKRREMKVKLKPPSPRKPRREKSVTSLPTAVDPPLNPAVSDVFAEENTISVASDSTEGRILAAMNGEAATHPDDIKVDGLSVGDILSHLTMMEIEGLVIQVAGGKFRKL